MSTLSLTHLGRLVVGKLCKPIRCSAFFRINLPNTYEQLAQFSKEPGVYRFVGPNGETLYVGAAGFGTQQGLKERVAQNFTMDNTGGTFRKNLALLRFDDDQVAALTYIREHVSVQLAKTPRSEVKYLEKLVIKLLKPECNFLGMARIKPTSEPLEAVLVDDAD